jgi:hypothetical protein
MTLKEAARLMGYKGKKGPGRLAKAIEAGAVACEVINRTTRIFDRNDLLQQKEE